MKRLSMFLLMVGMGTFLFAQSDELKPTKFENSTWHEVVLVKYKTGKVGEAKKIIEKFEAAGKKAGTPAPQTYWFVTGSYDMMLLWDMDGGPSDLEWKWDENSINWWKAFIKQEGSEEAANKLQEDYSSLISGSTRQILRKDN